MTPVDPQLLAAFADGELDAATADALRAAIVADPMLAAQVDQHRQLRERVQTASRGVLDEPVPARLLQALDARPVAATPINIDGARTRRSTRQAAPDRPSASTWARWGGMAASLVVGLSIGLMLSFDQEASPFETSEMGLLARGAVADALSNQLSSEPLEDSTVRLQISFVDQEGRHCRSFTTALLAGLACREGTNWAVQALLRAEQAGDRSALRQAATPLPVELLDIVDQRMRGDALDASAERAARQRNWQR